MKFIREETTDAAVTGRLYLAALASLAVLVAGTLVYPDTMVTPGLQAGRFRVSPLGVLFVVAAPAIAWFAWLRRSWLKIGVVDIMLVLTFVYIGVRATAATNGKVLGPVAVYLAYAVLLYYGTAVVGQGRDALRILFYVMVIMGFIAAAYALVEFEVGKNFVYSGILSKSMLPFPGLGYHRSSSTLGHPVLLGAFMVQVAPFLLFLFIRAKSTLRKVAWGAVIVAADLAMLVTYSKGAWGTASLLVLSGSIWLIWRRPATTRSLALLLLALSISIGGFTLFYHDTVYFGTLSKARTGESFNPRIYMWSRVPETFMANPLVGAGYLQGPAEVFRVYPTSQTNYRPLAIDNIYLTVLVEEGLIGVLLAGATIILAAQQVWRLLRRSGELALWGLPIIATLVLTLVNGLTYDSLMIWPNMVVFWLSTGMFRSLVERSRREFKLF